MEFKKKINLIRVIRGSYIWVICVNFFSPIFFFFWRYIFNLTSMLIYQFSVYSSESNSVLNKKRFLIVKNDLMYENFAKYLMGRISKRKLKFKRQHLLRENNEWSFSTSITDLINEKTKIEILKFTLSDKVLRVVLPYFGMIPHIGSISILFNLPRPELGKAKGSQEWHRDSGQYRSLNLFMCISNVDKDSGPYSLIGCDHIPFEACIPTPQINSAKSSWSQFRISDKNILRYVPKNAIQVLQGKPGSIAFVDPGACYHKGGFCLTKERIMLQISFVADTQKAITPISKQIKIKNRVLLNNIINNNPIKRKLIEGNDRHWFYRLGLTNPIYFFRRIFLSYSIQAK